MIGFPFDSLVTYDEYGNPIFDRAVSSKPLKSLISKLFTTGVMPNPSDNFQVFAGTEGMTVIVHAGYAVIDGGLKLEENNRTLEIQASDSNYDRIDTVVLRWNGNDNARVCDLYVLEGTPAPNPVRPELTRAGSIYEIGLADIIVPRNTGAISQQRITDTRYDSERCGIVSSVSEFDTSTLYAQIQADLEEFKDVEEADFIEWYETVKDRIDNITAERLQAQIDTLDDDKTDKTDIATVESGTTASRAYSVGELVYVSGTLYRVKTTIASGATFTEGTNIEVTNISNEFKELKNSRFGTAVELTANVDYIAPCDGYFFVGTNNLVGNNYAYGYVNGVILITATSNADSATLTGYPTSSLFVRKGTTLKFVKGTEGYARFYPLQ